jgi:hypothetical protein
VNALWMLPLFFGSIVAGVIQVENWIDRKRREARREGRRQMLRWLEERETFRSPW